MTDGLDIKLLGKDYRVACNPDERESLTAAVAFLDARLTEINTTARSSGERLAMMAALNLAHELLALKAASPETDGAMQLESNVFLARMENIESKLDVALAQSVSEP